MCPFLRNIFGFSQLNHPVKSNLPHPSSLHPSERPTLCRDLTNSFENTNGVVDARLYCACVWAWGLREFVCYCLRRSFSHCTIAVCLLLGWRHLRWKCAHHFVLSYNKQTNKLKSFCVYFDLHLFVTRHSSENICSCQWLSSTADAVGSRKDTEWGQFPVQPQQGQMWTVMWGQEQCPATHRPDVWIMQTILPLKAILWNHSPSQSHSITLFSQPKPCYKTILPVKAML